MNAMEMGQKVAELVREGRGLDAIREHYAEDIESVEAAEVPGMERTMTGRDAIVGKNEWWGGAHEVHEVKVDGPYPHGEDRFCLIFDMDVTQKESGQRFQMREVGHYTIRDGKIAREEFFYPMS